MAPILFSQGAQAQSDSLTNDPLKEYLEQNNIEYLTSPEGFYYTLEKEGDTSQTKPGKFVEVHYTGKLLNGKKFDSSYDRDLPFVFKLGENRVIKGWEKGIQTMGVGAKGTLYLPPNLAYGARAVGPIAPNSSLIFDIEVLRVLSPEEFEQWREKMQQAQMEARKKQMAELEKKKKMLIAQERDTLEAYLKAQGIEATRDSSGLYYVVEEVGDTSRQVQKGQDVKVHYRGKLLNGKVFDSSFERGEPISFAIGTGRVIQGWDMGIPLFNVGGKGTIYIPSPLGYGPRGAGSDIPPNSILIFDIEVVDAQ